MKIFAYAPFPPSPPRPSSVPRGRSRCGRARAGRPGGRPSRHIVPLPCPHRHAPTPVPRCGRARCPHRAANPRTARTPWSCPSPVPHAPALLGRRDGRPWRLATRALPPLPPRNSPAPHARAASPVVPFDGVRGHPRSMSPPHPRPVAVRTAAPHASSPYAPRPARGGSPPPRPVAARLFKHASYGRLPTYVRAPNPSTQKQPESTVHEQSRLCSCRSVRFVARCHAHRFDDASHSQYGLR